MNVRFVCSVSLILLNGFTLVGADMPPIDPGNLDRNAKPADDFYMFANGGWLARHPIPPEFSRWGAFEELAERNNSDLREILERCARDSAVGSAASIQQKVGDFYASGMDEQGVAEAGLKPLQPELDAIAAIDSRDDLPKALARLHLLGVNALFNATGEADEKDSRNQILILSQGGLGLPDRDYYIKEGERSKQIRDAYVAHIAKIFELVGKQSETANAAARTVLAFETRLAEVSKSRVALRDPVANYHKMPEGDLIKAAPGFDWQKYFTNIGLTARQLEAIDVKQPDFLTRATELAASAPLEQWKTYLELHLVREAAPYLSQPFVDENFNFYERTLTGAKELKPRWKRVLRVIDDNLGEALGQLYVRQHFPPEAKQRALEMVNDLRHALRDRLEALDWMGAETKANAFRKLDAFRVKIGYPDQWRDYTALEIKRQPYVLNVFAGQAFEFKRALAKVGQPVDPNEWYLSPPTVNAYYNPNQNEIVFPAGILQPPFFDFKADDAVNYGGIGAVIGHEMTHGFDDQGRQYDAAGNLQNWWKADDEKRFKERSEKIVKQFDSYTVLGDLHINGELTQGENIADLGGVKIACAAFEKALTRKPAEERSQKIDGFTPQQRFFLSWAQVWRNNIRDEALRLRIMTDPHSPGRYRVNGPLSNLPEFAAAFDVKPGSPMVRPPAERVQIW
jgi:predicted metalloendopeptidase